MYVENPNSSGGLLRLHSTYRHDLQTYASEEGRCLKTAAAFLKGLLALDGALAPILASMVRNDDESKTMLDDSTRAQEQLDKIKVQLEKLMHFDTEVHKRSLNEEFVEMFGEVPPKVVSDTFNQIGNPVSRMTRMYDLIGNIVKSYEAWLNVNRDQTDYYANYRILPKDFEQSFHQGRRRSSNEMNDSHNSLDVDELGVDNKEVYYSQEKQQYRQKLIDKKNSGRILLAPELPELLIQKIKSSEENK